MALRKTQRRPPLIPGTRRGLTRLSTLVKKFPLAPTGKSSLGLRPVPRLTRATVSKPTWDRARSAIRLRRHPSVASDRTLRMQISLRMQPEGHLRLRARSGGGRGLGDNCSAVAAPRSACRWRYGPSAAAFEPARRGARCHRRKERCLPMPRRSSSLTCPSSFLPGSRRPFRRSPACSTVSARSARCSLTLAAIASSSLYHSWQAVRPIPGAACDEPALGHDPPQRCRASCSSSSCAMCRS